MKNELFKNMKECPFCGSKVEANYASYGNGVFGNFIVDCHRCGLITVAARADRGNSKPRLDAYFDVWQHRAHEDEDDWQRRDIK